MKKLIIITIAITSLYASFDKKYKWLHMVLDNDKGECENTIIIIIRL